MVNGRTSTQTTVFFFFLAMSEAGGWASSGVRLNPRPHGAACRPEVQAPPAIWSPRRRSIVGFGTWEANCNFFLLISWGFHAGNHFGDQATAIQIGSNNDPMVCNQCYCNPFPRPQKSWWMSRILGKCSTARA